MLIRVFETKIDIIIKKKKHPILQNHQKLTKNYNHRNFHAILKHFQIMSLNQKKLILIIILSKNHLFYPACLIIY